MNVLEYFQNRVRVSLKIVFFKQQVFKITSSTIFSEKDVCLYNCAGCSEKLLRTQKESFRLLFPDISKEIRVLREETHGSEMLQTVRFSQTSKIPQVRQGRQSRQIDFFEIYFDDVFRKFIVCFLLGVV